MKMSNCGSAANAMVSHAGKTAFILTETYISHSTAAATTTTTTIPMSMFRMLLL